MRVPIIMPQLGESIAEATVISLAVAAGDAVAADQEIIEVETNKALLQVTAPCAGEIVELNAEPKETYAVGAVLGYIEAVPEEIARLGLGGSDHGSEHDAPGAEMEPVPVPMLDVEPGTPLPSASNGHGAHADVAPLGANRVDRPTDTVTRRAGALDLASTPAGGLPVPASLAGTGFLSPRLKARVAELGLQPADLAAVPGTGAGGRITTADLEKFLAEIEARATENAPAMRLAVGDAMRRTWSRPLATVGRPVCLDPVLHHRKGQPDPKPGITLYIIRALALALATDPSAASRLIGKRLVPAAAIDIGFAVEVDGGLMVPVLRSADRTPLPELSAHYVELVAAARRRQLPPGTTGNAAASVTNFGTFGLTWATPLPLPEETLMLGLGAGRRVPVWDDEKGAFVPVTEAELTLSFDHRSLDGGGAGRLLAGVTRLLAAPEKL